MFGGIEVNSKNCFLVAVTNRIAATLLPIIQQYILPGTTVVSDLWRTYNTVSNLGNIHLTVNHSIHFVDYMTQATTNHVESMWARAKRRNKRENVTLRTSLDCYLIEFLRCEQFGRDTFENFLTHIREVYPSSIYLPVLAHVALNDPASRMH